MAEQPELEALCEENRRLRRLLEEAESAARALVSGQIDSAIDPATATPVLLREAQAALHASERQFRAVFDGALDGLAVLDDAGIWVEANPPACLLLSRRRSEVIGRTSVELGLHDPALNAEIRLLEQRGRVRGDLHVPTPSGGERLLEYVLTAEFLPERHLLLLRDVSQRVRAEQALRDSEERYRELFDSNPHPILVDDPADRRILAVNEAAVQQYGWSRNEFLELSGDDIRPPEDVPHYRAWLEQSEREGSLPSEAGEWRHRRRDGSVFWASVFTRLVRWTGGPARLSVITDVTKRRQAEERLLLRERAIAGMSQGLLVTDPALPDNPIVYVNPGFERLTGYAPDEALGRNCRFLQGPETDPEARRTLREAVAAGTPATVELLNYRKDGSSFWNEVSVTPIRDESGRLIHFVGLQTDVTPRRELQTQLHHAQRLEAVGRLAGGIAHDFNNILGVILGYSEMLLQRPGEEAQRKRLRAVHEAAHRGAALTRQLLAFGRRQVLLPERVSLGGIVSGMREMLERLLGEDVELEASLPEGGGFVLVDPGQMEQVAMNLAVNARDAMPRGGRLFIGVREMKTADGDEVALEVRDEGEGMDEATRRRIFEPFFSTKPADRGTGLGLSTVYGIVAQSGGTIDVETEPGRGTTFTVRLPRVDPPLPEEEEAAVEMRAPAPAGERATPRVLLVEDEESLRQVGREILEGIGCDVVEACDAEEALRRAPGTERPADLLITDVVMPGLNGRQLADRLLGEGRVKRVLFTSGYTDEDVQARGVTPTEAGFLQKPYSVASLEAAVVKLVGRPARDGS